MSREKEKDCTCACEKKKDNGERKIKSGETSFKGC